MRIKTYAKGGYIDGGFTSGGGTMTGPLILAGNPTKDLEAAPKQYADAQLLAFDAERFTSGTLQAGRLPAFVGDVVSNTGSNNILLANIGIASGVYSKVTVNAKGLVTGGGGLTESDIPSLDWSKFSLGRPTTVAGYGITDALTKSGGTVSGALALSADPTATFHAATKQYIDNSVGSVSALKTGDIVRKLTSTTPTGFLRCNGGEASKTTFAALYAAVGDTFGNGGVASNTMPGAGQPWKQQYEFNTSFTGELPAFMNFGNLPTYIAYSQIVVTKNYVYLLGGLTGTGGYSSEIHRTTLGSDSGIGTSWTMVGNLPITLIQSHVVLTKNRVYLIGGHTQPGVYTSNVYTAPINTDGSLGAWTAGPSLPDAISSGQVIVTIDKVHLIAYMNVYTAPINTDGTLGTWTAARDSLPTHIANGQLAITKNRVYAIGANNGAVYTAPILGDGSFGTFVNANNNLPVSTYNPQIFVTRNRVHLISGNQNNRIYSAPINADGTLGMWSLNPNALPYAFDGAQFFAASARVYIMGGHDGTNYRDSIYFTDISGGLTDYSAYYNGTITATAGVTAGNFRLPDLTTTDATGMYSYIKT